MIRVLSSSGPTATIITVDGQLLGDYIDAVETSVQQALKHQRPVRLFLRDVSNIDDPGRMLLARLAANGVELSASGVYSSYIVAGIRRERAKRRFPA